jgi:hypothetical protein
VLPGSLTAAAGLTIVGTTVHTTGVNVEGLLTTLASITILLGFFSTLIVRMLKRSVKDTVEQVVADKVTPILAEIRVELKDHDTRIARLEGIEEGKRQAIAAAGVTSHTNS